MKERKKEKKEEEKNKKASANANNVQTTSLTYSFNSGQIIEKDYYINKTQFLLYFSMNYRDFSVKSKLIISLFQTVKLSLSISLFQKIGFS